MIRHLRKKGALFIEYALILAFVTGVGGFFVADTSIKEAIANTFSKVDSLLANEKSFKDKYPNNIAKNFVDFALDVAALDTRTKKLDGKDYKEFVNAIFKDIRMGDVSSELKFSDLTQDQKDGLLKFNLNVEDFPNGCFYKDELGRWYITWTDEDLSNKKAGDKVNVITYSISGGSNGYNTKTGLYEKGNIKGYYVGSVECTADAQGNISITNNQIRYDNVYKDKDKTIKVTSGMFDENSGYNYYKTAAEAENAYKNMS